MARSGASTLVSGNNCSEHRCSQENAKLLDFGWRAYFPEHEVIVADSPASSASNSKSQKGRSQKGPKTSPQKVTRQVPEKEEVCDKTSPRTREAA